MGKIFDFFCDFAMFVAELREFIELIRSVEEIYRGHEKIDREYQGEVLSVLKKIEDKI